jgi:hypothetical protein
MGLLDEIESGGLETSSRALRRVVPQYDYRQKKKRSETDRKLRDKVSREVGKSKSNLDTISDMAYEDGRRDVVGDIGDVTDSLLRLESKVETAPDGGLLGGVSSASEEDMVRLVEKDARLVEDAETLSEATDRLEEAVIDGKTDEIERRLHELRKTADDIERAFEDRKDILEGL